MWVAGNEEGEGDGGKGEREKEIIEIRRIAIMSQIIWC
jgi:hypothetical protein